MIEISFEINGKKIDPDDIPEGVQRSVLMKIKELLEEDLGELRCPEHGSAPSVICKGDSLNNLNFRVWACCENFANYAASQIDVEVDEREYKANIQIYGEDAHKFHERFFCKQCKRGTSHVLQFVQTYMFHRNDEGLPYKFCWHLWLIWSCHACNSLLLEDTFKAQEWFEGKPWEGDYEFVKFYPDSQKREDPTVTTAVIPTDNLTVKPFSHAPKKIQRAYNEVIQAYNNHLDILCTMGLRSLLEEIHDDKRISEEKSLRKKIENLTTVGVPTKGASNLVGVKEMGDKAVHELVGEKRKRLRSWIAALEEVLSLAYEFEPKTRNLNKSRKSPK